MRAEATTKNISAAFRFDRNSVRGRYEMLPLVAAMFLITALLLLNTLVITKEVAASFQNVYHMGISHSQAADDAHENLGVSEGDDGKTSSHLPKKIRAVTLAKSKVTSISAAMLVVPDLQSAELLKATRVYFDAPIPINRDSFPQPLQRPPPQNR